MTTGEILQTLLAMQDEGYRGFQCRLMPTVAPEAVIGVRTPQLRALAKTLAKDKDIGAFLADLPHAYYEENNLHAFLLESIRNFDACAEAVHKFLPYVDNWATCDSMSPKVFAKHPEALLTYIDRWLASDHVYAVRYAIVTLMRHYLDDRFDVSILERVAAVHSDEYYVKMAAAWCFASALTKQYDAALAFIEQRRLDPWTHNKAIQKATESFLIPAERKGHLRSLKNR